MKIGKKLAALAVLAGVLALPGCASTLFFPGKSAEIAADKVIDEVWRDVAKPAVANAVAKKP